MLLALKFRGAGDILQKNCLKDVLGIRMILQMNHTDPPDQIRIAVNGPVRLPFTPHKPQTLFLYPNPYRFLPQRR